MNDYDYDYVRLFEGNLLPLLIISFYIITFANANAINNDFTTNAVSFDLTLSPR